MLSVTMLATARNSDCQFWNVRFQNSAEPTYAPHESGSSSCRICCSLKAFWPATDCASQESRKITAMVRPRDHEYSLSRSPSAFAHAGESAVAYLPIFWSLSDSVPALASSLDSGEPFCRNHTVAR